MSRVSDEQKRAMYCQPCVALGRQQVAHDVMPDGRGICSWHRDGTTHPDDKPKPQLPPAVQASAEQPPDVGAPPEPIAEQETKEEAMPKEKSKICGRGCGRATHRGRCAKAGSASATAPKPKRANVARKTAVQVSGGAEVPARDGLVGVPVQAIDSWFERLDSEDILARLWASLGPQQKADFFASEVGA